MKGFSGCRLPPTVIQYSQLFQKWISAAGSIPGFARTLIPEQQRNGGSEMKSRTVHSLHRRIARAAGFFLGAMMLFSACSPKPANTESGVAEYNYPVQIDEVTISESPSKVAVLSPSLADIVTSLGSVYELKLAARSEDCTADGFSVLPSVDGAESPDVEALKTAGVQLVLTELEPSEELAKSFSDAGIQVLVLPKATTREELTTLFTTIGSALGGAKTGYTTAQRRVSSLLSALDDIQRLIPNSDAGVTAGYVINAEGEFASDSTMTGKLLAYAGAVNVAADGGTLSADELATANPDYIFCAKGLKETLTQQKGFASLAAVVNEKIYEIDGALMENQGSSMLDAVIELAGTMYPELKTEGLISPTSSQEVSSDTSSAAARPARVDANSSRADILALQDRLIELGYMQPPGDGFYGYWTKATVQEFQKRAGLEETGIADEKTMERLFANDAPKG